MKNARRKLVIVLAGIVVLFSAVFCGWVLDMTNNWFSLRWLEYQVKRNADPMELQNWATNLLAKHGGNLGVYQDFYGTNMPPGLRKVKVDYPNVQIFTPGEVWVYGSHKGSPFLVVGAPSLPTPTNQNIHPWKPGMYFVR